MESVHLQYTSSMGELMNYNPETCVLPRHEREKRTARPKEVNGKLVVHGQVSSGKRQPSMDELRARAARHSDDGDLPFIPSRKSL